MENEMIVMTNEAQDIQPEIQTGQGDQLQYYPSYNDGQGGKLVDEFIAAVKDDRMNTKRAILANNASTAKIQDQNARVIEACEKELCRPDLTEEYRVELIETMNRAAESTAKESNDSRRFQERQLDHSHKLPLKIIGLCPLILFGGIGGAVWAKAKGAA